MGKLRFMVSSACESVGSRQGGLPPIAWLVECFLSIHEALRSGPSAASAMCGGGESQHLEVEATGSVLKSVVEPLTRRQEARGSV